MCNPKKAEEYYKTGVSLYNSGNLESALAALNIVLENFSYHADTVSLIGLIFLKKREPYNAIKYFQKAVSLNPQNPKYHNQLAGTFAEIEDYCQAIKYYEQAIKLNPGNPFYYNDCAIGLQYNGDYPQAIEKYKLAINLKPDFAIFFNNIATAYEEWDKPEEAIRYFHKAIELEPNNVFFYNNLAGGYIDIGDYQSALEKYLFALSYEPENPDLNYNISILYLLLEDFNNGWRKHGYFGFRKEQNQRVIDQLKKPDWKGEDLYNKRIYVYSNQGFGDTIQFVRFLPLLKEKGAYLIFGCQPALKSLLQNCQGFDLLIDKSIIKSEVEFDLHIYLGRLPAIFKTSLESIPGSVPYIKTPEENEQKWKKILSEFSGFKVGFAWEPESKSKTLVKRRFPLENFFELANLPGLSLFSLQKGSAGQQWEQIPEGINIINLAEKINDFSDTAAIINNLDLIISIDTSVAHLAGALGKPVWTLLPFSPDWRWFLHRSDSPWYPTMKLFRQKSPGNWSTVTESLKAELIIEISKRKLKESPQGGT